jgi:hypothetical protein
MFDISKKTAFQDFEKLIEVGILIHSGLIMFAGVISLFILTKLLSEDGMVTNMRKNGFGVSKESL